MSIKEAIERYGKMDNLNKYPSYDKDLKEWQVDKKVRKWREGLKMARETGILNMVQELISIASEKYQDVSCSISPPITSEFSITTHWNVGKGDLTFPCDRIKINLKPAGDLIEIEGKTIRPLPAHAPREILEDALVWAYKKPGRSLLS